MFKLPASSHCNPNQKVLLKLQKQDDILLQSFSYSWVRKFIINVHLSLTIKPQTLTSPITEKSHTCVNHLLSVVIQTFYKEIYSIVWRRTQTDPNIGSKKLFKYMYEYIFIKQLVSHTLWDKPIWLTQHIEYVCHWW